MRRIRDSVSFRILSVRVILLALLSLAGGVRADAESG